MRQELLEAMLAEVREFAVTRLVSGKGGLNGNQSDSREFLITFRKKTEDNRSNNPRLPCLLCCFALFKR